MLQVSYPGVYILEVPSGARAITSVSTSIAAFFGRTERGPINQAVRILDRSSLAREFGGTYPGSDLIASVGQFFDNGGTDCYVVRVAHNPATASVTLRNYAGAPVLEAKARYDGAWGNNLRLEVDYNTANPDDTFNLRALQVNADDQIVASESFSSLTMDAGSARYAPDFVSRSSRLITLAGVAPAPGSTGFSQSRRPISGDTAGGSSLGQRLTAIVNGGGRFEMSIDGGPFRQIDIAGNAFPDAEADVVTELQQRIDPQLLAGTAVTISFDVVHDDFRVLRFQSATGALASVQIRRSSSEDLAGPLMLGVDQGGVETSKFAELRPVPTATMFTGDLNVLASLTQDVFNQMTLVGHPSALPLTNADGSPVIQTTLATDRWYQDAVDPNISITGNSNGVREKLQVLARDVNRQAATLPEGKRLRAEVWGYHLALIPTSGNAGATIEFATELALGGGTDIGTGAGATPPFTKNSRQYPLGGANVSAFQNGPGDTGRDDDGNPPDFNDFVGNPNDGTGLYALDTADLFNLMVIPADEGVDENVRLQIEARGSIYCSDRRAFMLVDAPLTWRNADTHRPTITANDVNQVRALFVKQNSAIYFPRIVVNDRGRRKLMGSSGAVAGVMARTDATRGVWKAPAGTEADVRGILDLEVNLSDREQGVLNKVGVNALRKFPSGFVVWGARTLAGTDDDPNEWKYVPIRRFALFLEESLYRGTRWIVFEPNDEPLWASIRKNIRAFMLGLFRQGAFQGSTPDEAFYVKCDQETTTATDRLLGIVNIEIGFAPLKPAEFVVLKIQQIADEIE